MHTSPRPLWLVGVLVALLVSVMSLRASSADFEWDYQADVSTLDSLTSAYTPVASELVQTPLPPAQVEETAPETNITTPLETALTTQEAVLPLPSEDVILPLPTEETVPQATAIVPPTLTATPLPATATDAPPTPTQTSEATVTPTFVPPTAGFTVLPREGRVGETITLTNTTTGDVTAWTWDFGDGRSSPQAAPPLLRYETAGRYTITLRADGPSGWSNASHEIWIRREGQSVEAIFRVERDALDPLRVCFADASLGMISRWAWDFGDGTTSTDTTPCHTYAAMGRYTVTLRVEGDDGESSSAVQDIVLHSHDAAPTAAFRVGKTGVMAGEALPFTDESIGIITAWAWDFGDGTGSAERHPTHRYSTEGPYSVTLHVSGPSGTSSATQSVSVQPHTLTVTCDFTVPGLLFAGTAVTLDGRTNAPAPTYRWTVNGVETGVTEDFTYTFKEDPSHVTLTVTDGSGATCTKSRTLTVHAADALVAAFDRSPNPAPVGGQVCFTDRSQGAVTGWTWDFGNGITSTLQHPCTTYDAAQRYTARLTVHDASGQSSSVTRTVDVLAAQALAIEAAPASGTAPLAITLTAVTSNIPASTLVWTFPNGDTAYGASVRYTFAQPGDYTVTVSGQGPFGESHATSTIQVRAGSALRAAFSASRTRGTVPADVCFTDHSAGAVTAWAWDFGNGITSEQQHPCLTYTQAGVYTVTLRVVDDAGLSASASQRIRMEALSAGGDGGTPVPTIEIPLEKDMPSPTAAPTLDTTNAADPTTTPTDMLEVAAAPVVAVPQIIVNDPSLSKIGYLPAGSSGLTGEALTWEVTVSNPSALDETNVVITDTVRNDLRIDGVRVVPEDKGTATFSGANVRVTFPLIEAGESYTFYIDTTVLTSPLDGLFTNRAISGGVFDDATVSVPAATTGPIPDVTGVPSDVVFAGQQYCFGAAFSNNGTTAGYGPYVQMMLDPRLTYASASFLGISLDAGGLVTLVGTFGANGTLLDPYSDRLVTGTPGHRFYIIEYPLGSILPSTPDAIVDICVDVDPNAVPFVNLPIELNPGFRFGTTPIGENGAIVNGSPTDGNGYYRPELILFDKTSSVPEGERPPGAAWTYQYILTTTLASRQTITNLVYTDILPNGAASPTVEFVAGSAALTANGSCSMGGVPVIPNDVPNGGTLTVTIPTVTNTGNSECTITLRYSVYILDILTEANNTTTQRSIINNATLNYRWQGNARPPLTDSTTIVTENTVFQKSVNQADAAPGESLVYRIDVQVTQHGSVQQLTITDTMSAGVDYAGGATFFGRTSGGAPGPVCGAGCPITVTPVVNGDGTLTLTFNITAAAGGAVIPGGTGGFVTYNAIVRQTYRGSGAPVLADDVLNNTVRGTFQLVQGGSFQNDSQVAVPVRQVAFTKTTITTPTNGVGFVHGETVTFRLTLDIPTGDTRDIVLRDVFPLPVFVVNDADFGLNTPPGGVVAMPYRNTTGICASFPLPPANPGPTDRYRRCGIAFGPGTTIATASVQGITVDAASNSIAINLGDISASTPQRVVLDLTLAIVDQPFHYDLLLSNQARATSRNSANVPLSRDAVSNLAVGGAQIDLKKGVIATTNPNATFSPPALTTPPDNDLVGADTGDLVTYRITARNIGVSDAFNVVLRDPQPAWLELCVFDTASVRDGSGNALAYTGSPLAVGGLRLTNALPGSLGALPDAPAQASFDVRCRIRDSVVAGTSNINTARADYKAYDPSVPNSAPVPGDYPPSFDRATVQTKRPAITKTADKTTATIGELVTYTVGVTLGEGTFTSAHLIDALPDNLAFVGCTSLTASAGVGGLSGVCAPAVTNGGRDVDVPLGTLTIAATTGGGTETITWVYTAVVLNSAANQAGTRFENEARFNYDTDRNASIEGAEISIVEPVVTLAKSRVNAGPFDAGDVITFRLVVSNTGALAHNLALTDVIPTGFTYVPASLTHTAGTAPATLTLTGATINATWTTLPATTGTSTLTYQVTVNTNVQANQSLVNTATVTYTSQPGTPNFTTHNALGVERTGRTADAGGAVNDYISTSVVTTTLQDVALTKAILSTNQAFTPGRDVAIGEIVRYRVSLTVPEGETRSAVLTDALDNGLAFVNLGAVPANANIVFPAGVTASTGNAAAILGAAVITNSGRNVTLNFGTLTNSNNNAAAETILIEYDVVMLPTAVLGVGRNNAATLSYGSGADKTAQALNAVPRAPNMTIVKSANPTSGDAGDTITFTLTISNPPVGTVLDAHDVTLNDPLPADMTFVSFLGTTGLAPTSGPTFSAGVIQAAWTSFAVGQTATIRYTVTLNDSVTAGQAITNTALVSSTSLPGVVNVSQSVHVPNAIEASYTTSGAATVTVIGPQLASKTVSATSFTGTTGTQVTIGEQVTYTINVTLPEGSNIPLTAVDTLPTGLAHISSRVVSVPAGVTGLLLAPNDPGVHVGQTITFNFGAVSNPADGDTETVVMEVVARVLNVPSNTEGTIRTNLATAGGTTASADVTIVEPTMTLTKSLGASPVARGTTTPLTLTAVNTSPHAAYDVVLTDILDDGFSAVTGLTVTGGVGCTVGAAGTPITITARCTQVNGGATLTVAGTLTIAPTLTPPTQTLPNTATLTYDTLPEGHSDDAFDRNATRTASASLDVRPQDTTLSKTDTPDPVIAGENIIYTIRFTNNGTPNLPLTNVVLTDVLPAPPFTTTSAVTVTSATPIGTSCLYTAATRTLRCTLATLAVNDTMTVVFSATVPPNTPAGTYTNSVNATSAEGVTQTTSTPTTVTPQTDLAVVKTINRAVGYEGDARTYTLAVRNNGPSDATNFTLTDTLPTGLMFTGAAPTGCTYPTTTTLTCTLSLANGVTRSLITNVVIGAGTASSTLTNTATVAPGPNQNDSVPANDTSRAVLTVNPFASLGDRVWLDVDGDGVQDAAETGGFAAQTVTLTGTTDDGTALMLTTTTGVNGVYTFGGLKASDAAGYTIRVAPVSGAVQTYDLNGPLDHTAAGVALAVGQNRTDVDFGYTVTGALGDHVWRDSNRNGVQDGTEANVAGVTVRLSGVDGLGNIITRTTTTNSSGHYLFLNLPPSGGAGYTVSISGYAASLTPGYDLDGGADATAVAALPSGQSRTDMDFALLPRGQIGDLVWQDANGDGIKQAAETGFANVDVTLTGTDSAGNTITRTVQTDANGLYLFSDLENSSGPGYTVTVDKTDLPGGAAAWLETYDRDGTLNSQTPRIRLINNGVLDVDFGYVTPSNVGDVVWDDADSDSIQDVSEARFDGVRVMLRGKDRRGRPVNLSTLTSGGGVYSFANLKPGLYTVWLVSGTLPRGYASNYDRDGGRDARTQVGLAVGGTTLMDVDFGLTPAGSIGDMIWYDDNDNGVRDGSEGGIAAGWIVQLLDANTGVKVSETTTYGDGLYLFPKVLRGDYIVVVLDVPAGYYAAYDLDGSEDSQTRIFLGIGEHRRDLDFAFTDRRGSPPQPGGPDGGGGSSRNGEPEMLATEEPMSGTEMDSRPESATSGGPLPETAPVCPITCREFQIYHTNRTGDWEIFRLGGYTGEPAARANLSQGEGDDFAPSRSPDGDWIVFSSERDGNREIYVAPTNGDDRLIQRVTINTIAIDTDPSWGPGSAIVYESTRDGNWNLYLFDVATGRDLQLTDDPSSDVNAAWSPDGSHLLFQSNRSGQWQIYRLDLRNFDLATSAPVLLSDGTGFDVDPVYSNDGRQILFRSLRSINTVQALYLMWPDGSGVRQISSSRGDALNAIWSPDDALIAYQSNLDGDADIYVYEVASGLTRKVTDNDVADYAPSWFCGTTTLLFTSEASTDPTIAKDADIYAVSALPMSAPPFDVATQTVRLTEDAAADIYPQDTPAEEDASREARLPESAFSDVAGMPLYLNLDLTSAAPDPFTRVNTPWTPLTLTCRVESDRLLRRAEVASP